MAHEAHNGPPTRVAVIGAGPRGLSAMEALIRTRRNAGERIDLTFLDDAALPGAGPNFDPAQTSFSLLNTPVRDIDIPPAPSLPSGDFVAWQRRRGHGTGDCFPPRAQLGSYLMQRFREVAERTGPGFCLSIHKARADRLHRDGGEWHVVAGQDSLGPFDEVLLVPGQPQSRPDAQWAEWLTHAETSGLSIMQAYPDRGLLAAARNWAGAAVAIRGLGLTSFDVLRYLTVGLGGRFEGGFYHPSGHEPARIFLFSLNGQPPYPKPATAAHDRCFSPMQSEAQRFRAAVKRAATHDPRHAARHIGEALVEPALRISAQMGAGFRAEDFNAWLDVECISPGAQETQAPAMTVTHGIEMATGSAPPSAGYIIGQLWRKLQTELRASFNEERVPPNTAKAIVELDEGLKRYSFGPPLASAQELLALIASGLVDLCVSEDPAITPVSGGWQLVAGSDTAAASVMIDAVLPPPSLERVREPLIAYLVAEGWLSECYKGSGARARPDGSVIGSRGEVARGLCLLGRMATGSVIAPDSLHDCFGGTADRWAAGVIARASPSKA